VTELGRNLAPERRFRAARSKLPETSSEFGHRMISPNSSKARTKNGFNLARNADQPNALLCPKRTASLWKAVKLNPCHARDHFGVRLITKGNVHSTPNPPPRVLPTLHAARALRPKWTVVLRCRQAAFFYNISFGSAVLSFLAEKNWAKSNEALPRTYLSLLATFPGVRRESLTTKRKIWTQVPRAPPRTHRLRKPNPRSGIDQLVASRRNRQLRPICFAARSARQHSELTVPRAWPMAPRQRLSGRFGSFFAPRHIDRLP